jgi:ADP-ribose pyrophosphatase YjhB (NUDIX family)
MNDKEIYNIIKGFDEKLPKFSDGRIDYHSSKEAPVISVFIKHENKILLLKRSGKVSNYRGLWNALGGFLDELKPIKEKVLEEVKEETGIEEEEVREIKFGERKVVKDLKINKTWILFPVVVELKNKPEIKLDWESSDYKWISFEEIDNYDTVYKLKENFEDLIILN